MVFEIYINFPYSAGHIYAATFECRSLDRNQLTERNRINMFSTNMAYE